MVEDNYKNFTLAMFSVVCFVILVMYISFYVRTLYPNSCYYGLPLWSIVLLVSLSGLFVGSFVYYILNRQHIIEKQRLEKGIFKTLSFLDGEEKRVILVLLKCSGRVTQSKLTKLSGFNKVKISRILNKLENKNLIKREKYGMTNNILLDRDLYYLFKDIDISKFKADI